MSTQYFEVTAEVVVATLKNGKDKKVKEVFLVDAMSVQEAEVKVVKDYEASSSQMDFEVVQVKKSRVFRVL